MKKDRSRNRTAAARCAAAVFIISYPLAGELVAAAGLGLGVTAAKLCFALCGGAFLYLLGHLCERRRLCFWVQAAFCCLVSAAQLSQFVYWKIFSTPYYLRSTAGLAAALEFWRVALDAILHNWLAVLAMLCMPAALFTVYRRLFYTASARAPRRPAALACVLLGAFGLCFGLARGGGASSPRGLLLGACVPVAAAREFGLLPAMALDLKSNVLGISIPDAAPGVCLSEVTVAEAAPTEQQTPGGPERGPEDYPENVLDIEFDLAEQDPLLRDMNEYFSARTATRQNEYTGLFEGKNLILITAEGFSKFLIDPVRTPTLYKLYAEGFQFEHFYTPLWGVSTTDGEFTATTGLVPQSGVWSYTQIIGHTMPFALGNQFSARGAASLAFHNHSYTYYNRDRSYPTMGYAYYGPGHGLDITAQWPESDVELVEQSLPYYIGEERFHAYYMTVSGHLAYTYTGNMMATKHRDEVEGLPFSDAVKAYIACQLELEDALTKLLAELEAAGRLEDTVIALSADHYPYGLTGEEYAELRGGQAPDTAFALYENAFLLWTPGMDGPVQVDTYCSSLDILPTLSNLFGLPYDSRLMMGTDIFSGTAPVVLFYDHSFINGDMMYDAAARRVTPRAGKEITQALLDAGIADAEQRFAYSAKIIENDYYGYLFGAE